MIEIAAVKGTQIRQRTAHTTPQIRTNEQKKEASNVREFHADDLLL
jgi:hypothetical protein